MSEPEPIVSEMSLNETAPDVRSVLSTRMQGLLDALGGSLAVTICQSGRRIVLRRQGEVPNTQVRPFRSCVFLADAALAQTAGHVADAIAS